MTIDLTDHVALVTGSAHRVGKAIALELARAGVHILVHYHNAEDSVVRDTLRDIKSLGVDAVSVQADISQPEGVDAVLAALKERFGRLHILVNSASVFQTRAFMDISVDDWNLTLNVNLRAPFLLTQATVPLMMENSPAGGVVVNITDQGVDAPWLKRPHHGISKSALWMLTQATAHSLGPEIRANAIVPGPVLKPDHTSDAKWSEQAEGVALKRTGDPADVGRAVVFVAREPFINGALLHVNGGQHLMHIANSRLD